MKTLALALALIGISSLALETPPALAQASTQAVTQAAEAQFSLTVDAPIDRALALFGPVVRVPFSARAYSVQAVKEQARSTRANQA